MLVFANQQMLNEILETPCPLGGFLRLSTDDEKIISTRARRCAACIFAVPEIDDNRIRILLNRYHVGALAFIVIVNDESREAFFKMMNKPVLYGVFTKLTVFPPALLGKIHT